MPIDFPHDGRRENTFDDGARERSFEPVHGEALFDGPIVWALDAFPNEQSQHAHTAAALMALAPHSTIYPVYVLSEESFAERGFSGFLKPALKPMALKALGSLISEMGELHFEPPRVLTEASISGAACARKLSRFAERIGASLIAVGSYGRTGISRFFMGSFSESLLDRSDLPVLIAGPQARMLNERPRTVLFVTDGAHGSMSTYHGALHTAVHSGAHVHVFWRSKHRCEHAHFHEPAEALGIEVRVIDNSSRKTTATSVLDYIDYLDPLTTLVVMTSQIAGLTTAISGGIAREVIRLSPSPVYMVPKHR